MARDKPLDYLIIYVLGGHGFVEAEGRRFDVGAGDLLTLRPGQPHVYGADPADPWEILWIHFDGALAAEFLAALWPDGGVRVALGLDEAVREAWIELVIAHGAAADHDPPTRTRDDTALAALLGLLVYRWEVHQRAPAASAPLDAARVHAYLHHHLREPITLAVWARHFGFSASHFTRMFRRQFGVSPIHYLVQTRVAMASSLLRETRLPIKQVSASVGYDDPYYFSRLFKQHAGISPAAYRARQRGGVG